MKTKTLPHRRSDSGLNDPGDQRVDEPQRERFGMDDEPDLDEPLRSIACGIRRMSDLDPPPAFLPSVMDAIRSRKLPWWVRLSRWAGSQKSITFTPLQAASALGVLFAVCAATILFGLRADEPGRYQTRARDEVPVVLTFKTEEAQSVSVIGSFNNWHAQGYEMRKATDQTSWSLVLELPAGRYEYAFVVDGGKIVPDPGADLYQDDGFGSRNAVMIVGKNGNEKNI